MQSKDIWCISKIQSPWSHVIITLFLLCCYVLCPQRYDETLTCKRSKSKRQMQNLKMCVYLWNIYFSPSLWYSQGLALNFWVCTVGKAEYLSFTQSHRKKKICLWQMHIPFEKGLCPMNIISGLNCKQAFHRLFLENKQLLANCRETDFNSTYFIIRT